jgi:2-methylcitrate dehydratase PrpD
MPTTLETLAQWAHDLDLDAVPAAVQDRARLQHLSLAGALREIGDRPEGRALRKAGGTRGAARVSTGGTAPRRDAVRLHTGLSGLLSMDDQLLLGHAPGAGVAASWAVAKRHTVGDLLAATIAANEVAGRIGASLLLGGPAGQAQAAVSAAAAAVATARLDGLDARAMARALALALNAPPAASERAMSESGSARASLCAAPAVHGVEAASLAASGLDAPLDLLDGDAFFAERTPQVLRAAFTGLGTAWLTATLSYKLLPASTFVQAPVDAVWEILRRHIKAADKRLRPDQVEGIEVRVAAPAHRFDAQADRGLVPAAVPFSIPSALGVLVVGNGLTPAVLTEPWLRENEEAVRAVAAKVRVVHDPARTAMALGPMLQAVAPLFADVPPLRLVRLLADAAPPSGAARRPVALDMLRRVVDARPDRALSSLRGALPDLATARLGEFTLHTDAEVLLYTTRGGTWPERRTGPEGAPGWPWQDTRARVLARHGDGADALAATATTEDAAGWVGGLLG